MSTTSVILRDAEGNSYTKRKDLGCCEVIRNESVFRKKGYTLEVFPYYASVNRDLKRWANLLSEFFPDNIKEQNGVPTIYNLDGKQDPLILTALIRLNHRTPEIRDNFYLNGKQIKKQEDAYFYIQDKYFTEDLEKNWEWFLATYYALNYPLFYLSPIKRETFLLAPNLYQRNNTLINPLVLPHLFRLKKIRKNVKIKSRTIPCFGKTKRAKDKYTEKLDLGILSNEVFDKKIKTFLVETLGIKTSVNTSTFYSRYLHKRRKEISGNFELSELIPKMHKFLTKYCFENA